MAISCFNFKYEERKFNINIIGLNCTPKVGLISQTSILDLYVDKR